MESVILNNQINTKHDLISFALLYSKEMKVDASIDPYYFLLALMQVESSFGIQNIARFELSYSRSSIAYKKSRLLQEGHEKWGDLAACSYGPTQILWIVAAELGYNATPIELFHGANSIPYTVKLLNKLAAGGGNTLERLAAAYNGGLGALKSKDSWPAAYIKKFVQAYEDMKFKH